ncbi:FGGY-family carbohydrate kinase [Roseibium aggregatum]|uniref:FGGY-family carbohydrate kinase n=1 Tax=Roseibium aggregatum TaxID=187304 RepID=UPI003A9794B9
MVARLLGIDSGGTMTKVALFDDVGNEIACEHSPNRIQFPHAGWTERDPDGMWRAACEGIRTLLEKTGTSPGDIAAVTAVGYGAGLYFVDADGRVVRPGIGSTDTRSAETIARWERAGLKPDLESAIQQAVWAGQSLPILGWFKRHQPDVLDRTRHLLLCKDFLRLRLCGDISTDPTDAGCAGFADVSKGCYATDAFIAAGLEDCIEKLPEIGTSTDVAGYVTAEAAAQTGLLEGTPVCRGVYDVVACSLASGLTRADELGVVAGTFSINSRLYTTPCLDPLPTLQVAYPLEGKYLATMAGATSASNLEWVCSTLLAAEADVARRKGRSIYEVCSDLVESAIDRDCGILFFPYVFGGPSGAPAGLLGVQAGSQLPDVLRAVFEGIVFAHCQDIGYLLGKAGTDGIRRVLLSGGPSKSPVWSQIFCDALNLPLAVANGSEFGAKGAAMCASVGVGMQPDLTSAISAMTRISRTHTPDPDRVEVLKARYRRYSEVGERLAAAWVPHTAPDCASSYVGSSA